MVRFQFLILTCVILCGLPSCNLEDKKNHDSIPTHIQKGFNRSEQDLLLSEATPLIKAVNNNDLTEVQKLIKKGADVNQEIGGGEVTGGLTALMVAAQNGNLDILKALIAAGADVNHVAWSDQPHAGKPVLWYAIDSESPEAVRILIEAGANPNSYTENPIIINNRQQANIRNLPLLSAAINSYAPIAIIKALVDGGADVNQRDQRGALDDWTPLMVAAYRGYTDATKELLKAGADPTLKNKHDYGWLWYRSGRTALDYAKEEGHDDIVKILQK